MFPSPSIDVDEPIFVGTGRDFDVFTHMIYLDIDPSTIAARRASDSPQKRQERETLSLDQLSDWQGKECSKLRSDCYRERVFFTTISDATADGGTVAKLILSMLEYDQKRNHAQILAEVDKALKYDTKALLVLDADKTLSEADSGKLYCQTAYGDDFDAFKAIFDRYGYVHDAFRQVALLYNEKGSTRFKEICSNIAKDIGLYRKIEGYLKGARCEKDVIAIIVSCGPRHVWQEVLRREGFSKFTVIGLGQADDTVVDPDIKKAIVKHAQKRGIHVTAFGDSPMDIPMLRAANKSVVVVGPETTRSKSMDKVLTLTLGDDPSWVPSQVIMGTYKGRFDAPGVVHRTPRYHDMRLPTVQLDEHSFLNESFRTHYPYPSTFGLTIHIAEQPTANILMTPMRDASNSGPVLRRAHMETGRYLALQYLPAILGVVPFEMPHVQGNVTEGFRLKNEPSTLIIALMRGGDPMAFGISEVMPAASFIYSKNRTDIDRSLLAAADSVILVDSVVNSGHSMKEYLDDVSAFLAKQDLKGQRGLCEIAMVAGVVQENAMKMLQASCEGHEETASFNLITLRTSANQYTGKGGTDTGHRLFNTTLLE
jgi:phosphoserine phosphatase/uracil phosphoribosyltransferase